MGNIPQDEDGVVFAELAKNTRGEVIRVQSREYRGVPLVDIRTWYRDEGGELRPGRGITFKQELLPDIIEALQAAQPCLDHGTRKAA